MKQEEYQISHTLEGCRVRFTITASKKIHDSSYKKALKEVNSEVEVKGFRKNKVPEALLQQYYPEKIASKARSHIASHCVEACLATGLYRPYKKEYRIEELSLDKEHPVCSVSFEVYPQVPSIDFSLFQPEPFDVQQYSKEQKELFLKQLQEKHAHFTPTEQSVPEVGSWVCYSLEVSIGDRLLPMRSLAHICIPQERHSWLEETLLQMQANETKKVEDAQLAFPATVTLHSIDSIELPLIDDALAQKEGIESKEKLEELLQQRADKKAHEEHVHRINQKFEEHLFEQYKFALPASALEEKKEELSAEYRHRIEQAPSAELKAYWERYLDDIDHQACKKVTLLFLYRYIAEQAGIPLHDPLSMPKINQLCRSEEVQKHLQSYQDPQSREKALHEVVANYISSLIHEYIFEQVTSPSTSGVQL